MVMDESIVRLNCPPLDPGTQLTFTDNEFVQLMMQK